MIPVCNGCGKHPEELPCYTEMLDNPVNPDHPQTDRTQTGETMTNALILTADTVLRLAELIEASLNSRQVVHALDAGNLFKGTARSIGDVNGNFAGPDDDIRDCFLRVTGSSGFEHFLPVTEVVTQMKSGVFAVVDK